MIAFSVPGDAVPKMRARVVFSRGGVRAYTPRKTAEWEARIASAAASVMREGGMSRIDGPLAVSIVVDVMPPRSWPTWKREAAIGGAISPTTRPDLDNIGKAILDAINGVAYGDDAQIVDIRMRSRYALQSSVAVEISALLSASAQAVRRRSDLEGVSDGG